MSKKDKESTEEVKSTNAIQTGHTTKYTARFNEKRFELTAPMVSIQELAGFLEFFLRSVNDTIRQASEQVELDNKPVTTQDIVE